MKTSETVIKTLAAQWFSAFCAVRAIFRLLIDLALLLLICVAPIQLFADELLVEEVASGIFVYTGTHKELDKATIGEIGNSGFIVGKSGVMVIDPGGSLQFAIDMRRNIAERTELPVKYVVLSHFHPDHVAGVAVYGSDIEIIAHHHYPRALLQRSQFYIERFELSAEHWARGRPGSLVKDSLLVDLGSRSVEITAHDTAHTDNDLSVFDALTNTLWASDLVFQGRTPSLDGSLNGWIEVLDSLKFKRPDLVVPGHGQSGSWDTTVDPQYEYLIHLRNNIRQALSEGTTLSEAIAKGRSVNASTNSGNWVLFESQHPVNITKAYTELEWE